METPVAFFHRHPMSDELKKSVMEQKWYDMHVEFVLMNCTVNEYLEYVKANGYYKVFVVYDECARECVTMYSIHGIGIVDYISACSSVITSDMLGLPLFIDIYHELSEYPKDEIPHTVKY